MTEPYDDLYRAIGRVVYEWAWLEKDIAGLVFDFCALQSPAFYEDSGVGKVSIALNANLDLRANIIMVKTMAHQTSKTEIFPRLEKVLNNVGNEMRNERNRYVHDAWFVAGGRAHRMKAGSRILRQPASGETIVEHGGITHFVSLQNVHDFADKIHETRMVIMAFSDEAENLFRLKYPEEE